MGRIRTSRRARLNRSIKTIFMIETLTVRICKRGALSSSRIVILTGSSERTSITLLLRLELLVPSLMVASCSMLWRSSAAYADELFADTSHNTL
jgi:hypothetical protein